MTAGPAGRILPVLSLFWKSSRIVGQNARSFYTRAILEFGVFMVLEYSASGPIVCGHKSMPEYKIARCVVE